MSRNNLNWLIWLLNNTKTFKLKLSWFNLINLVEDKSCDVGCTRLMLVGFTQWLSWKYLKRSIQIVKHQQQVCTHTHAYTSTFTHAYLHTQPCIFLCKWPHPCIHTHTHGKLFAIINRTVSAKICTDSCCLTIPLGINKVLSSTIILFSI